MSGEEKFGVIVDEDGNIPITDDEKFEQAGIYAEDKKSTGKVPNKYDGMTQPTGKEKPYEFNFEDFAAPFGAGPAVLEKHSFADQEGKEILEKQRKAETERQIKENEAMEKYLEQAKIRLSQRLADGGKVNLDGLSPANQKLLQYLSMGSPEKMRYDFAHEKQQQKDISELRQAVQQNVLSAYATSGGQFDWDKATSMAEDRITKGPTSRGALDKLQKDGPMQMQMPEMPDRDRDKLANIISTTVAGLVQGISMGASGTKVASATPQAGLQQQVQFGQMLAQDIETVRAKRERVKEMNFMLEKEHDGNVLKALADFENRADASERMYQNQKLAEVNRMVDRYDKWYGVDQQLAMKAIGIEGGMGQKTFDMNKFNVAQRNAYRKANAQIKAQLYMSQQKQEAAMAKHLLPSQKFTVKNMALAQRHGINMGQGDAVMMNLQNVSNAYVGKFYGDAAQYSNNMKVALSQLINSGQMTRKQATQAINNSLYMNANGTVLLGYRPADLVKLGSSDITTSGVWEQAMQSSLIKDLYKDRKVFKDQNFATLTGVANYSGAIAQISNQKPPRKDEDQAETWDNHNKQFWGVTND